MKEIKDQTQQALSSVSAQSDKVKDSLTSLEAVLEDLKKGDEQRDEEFKNVKNDVDALKDMVPKASIRNEARCSGTLSDLCLFFIRCWIATRKHKIAYSKNCRMSSNHSNP